MNFEEQLNQILLNCDKDQLNKYLNDEESADLLVKSMEQYQRLLKEKEDLQRRNKEIAESNLGLEPVLNNLKIKLRDTINEFEEAKNDYLSLKDVHDAQSLGNNDFSLNSICNSLKQTASREEDESDRKADEFYCSFNAQHTDEELNSFQKQFIEERTQVHIKKVKADKLNELLTNRY